MNIKIKIKQGILLLFLFSVWSNTVLDLVKSISSFFLFGLNCDFLIFKSSSNTTFGNPVFLLSSTFSSKTSAFGLDGA